MTNKKIAILQSNYIPWKGYFDLINRVDEFILYDDMQYTTRDWRNRNKVKTRNGLEWLTIPVIHKKREQKINETRISDENWNKKHWNTIKHSYSRSKYFKEYKDLFEDLYLNNNEEYLSQINFKFIKAVNELLCINTKLKWSSEFKLKDGKSEKLIQICKDCGATEYLSGPAAMNYLSEELFSQEKIKVSWMEYNEYLEYNQLFPPFEHGVTILDLIFNEGPNASEFMKSFEE